MSKHVKLVLEMTEYGDDDGAIRQLRAEFSGGFERKPWLHLNQHGDPLIPCEVHGLNEIMAGFKTMVGEAGK